MTEQHECRWQAMTIREPVHQRGQFFFVCIEPDCPIGTLVASQAEDRLNEYETLKAENEAMKKALHKLGEFDYRLGIDAMRAFASAAAEGEL